MMAHNLSAHALSSTLNCRSSPYLSTSQDHIISSRQMPLLSAPDILKAFHQIHPSPGAANGCNNALLRSASTHIDPWESLLELKWLDPGENNMMDRSIDNPAEPPGRFAHVQSSTNLVPEKSGLPGRERSSWAFSELYADDPAVENGMFNCTAVDDSLSQFSLQHSMVTASPASSGSSMMLGTKPRVSSRINYVSNFASTDFPTSAGSMPPDWCTDTPSCSSGSHKRPALSDRPDSDLTQEISNSRRSDFQVDAENFVPDRLTVPDKRASPSTNKSSLPAEKRKRGISQDSRSTAARDNSSPTEQSNKKATIDKGSVSNSAVTKKQAGSPGRECGSKKSSASVLPAVTATQVSDHEIHIWTERERRKKMNGMFTTLHSLLPHVSSKTWTTDEVPTLKYGDVHDPTEISDFTTNPVTHFASIAHCKRILRDSKADKSTIVDEAINFIQSLEVTMNGMLKRKCEKAKISSSSMNLPISLEPTLQASMHGPGSPMAAVEMDKISPANNMSGCGVSVQAGGLNSVPRSMGASHHKFQTICSPNVVLNFCGIDAFITICSPRGRPGLLCRVLFVMESHRLHVVNAHISTTDETNLLMLHAQSADRSRLSNPDMLNITLQDLTNCLKSGAHAAQ